MMNGITVNAAGGDALAFLMDPTRSGVAVKALRGSLDGLKRDAAAAGRALSQAAGALKGVTAALMQTATVSAGLDRGLVNLYRWSKTGARAVAQSLDLLATDALYLKNSLAAMASPLISVFAPAINGVTERFAGAFNLVSQMVARLSGKATYVAARKAGDAWDSVGGRISGAASALRRYIAGFDQLNVLYAGASGGGSGGGGAAAAGMFETRPIEGAVKDLADTLREAVEAGDWQAVGRTLGERVNAAVAAVDWAGLGEKLGGHLDAAVRAANAFLKEVDFLAIGQNIGELMTRALRRVDFTQLGEALGRLLVSAVEVGAGAAGRFDWSAFGAKLAQGLNGFLGALNAALDGIDWPAMAARMTSGLNRFVAGVDWHAAGSGLGRRINDLVAVCRAGVEGFDWSGAGRAMSAGLNGLLATVDWAGLGRWLNRTLSGLLDFGISLVEGFDARGFADGVGRALEQVDWPALARKLWALLRAALSKLGEAAGTLLFGGTTRLDVSVGLLQRGWNTLKAWIEGRSGGSASGLVALARSGWTLVSAWVRGYMGQGVSQNVGLTRLWSTVSAWVNGYLGSAPVRQEVGLARSPDWRSVAEWVGRHMGSARTDQPVGLKQDAWRTVARWVSASYMGGVVNSRVGLTQGWKGTPQQALRLTSLTATVTVGLKTTADAVKSFSTTVASGINTAISAVLKLFGVGKAEGGVITPGGRSLSFAGGGAISDGWWNRVRKYAAGTARAHGTLFAAGEAGPEIVGHINGRTEILNRSQLAQTMYGAVSAGMLAALGKVRFRLPAVAAGAVLPYEIAAQLARAGKDIENTLNANNEDLIQVIVSAVGAQTNAIVAALQALRAGGDGGLSARQVIDAINRQTQMFGASPLM